MGELPEGWRVVALAEVADTSLGKMLDKARPKGDVRVPYLRNVNVQWGRIDAGDVLTVKLSDEERARFAVESGDLLVCEGGEIGRCAIWTGGAGYMAYQKALHRVRSRGPLDLRWLRYLLEHYDNTGALAARATGSTILHLPQQQLRQLPVPLPTLDKQRRIVEVLEDHLSRLDAAEAGIAHAEHRLKALHKSVLLKLIPDVADYPTDWKASTVEQAGKVDLGRQRHPDWHAGFNMRPYLRVANVFEDRIDTRSLYEMHWPGDTFDRFRLLPGDVLLNEGQTPELLGRPALYRGHPSEVAFTNSLLRFQVSEDVLPAFALLVFRRHMHAGRFTRESRITTNIAHLSAARLKPIEFPIPPLHVQEQLVDRAEQQLSALTRLGVGTAAARSRSAGLRRALLGAALSGRLT